MYLKLLNFIWVFSDHFSISQELSDSDFSPPDDLQLLASIEKSGQSGSVHSSAMQAIKSNLK